MTISIESLWPGLLTMQRASKTQIDVSSMSAGLAIDQVNERSHLASPD